MLVLDVELASQAIGVGPILRPNRVLLHQEEHPGRCHRHANPFYETFLDLDVLEAEGLAQAAQDVDVEVPDGGTYWIAGYSPARSRN